MESALTPMLVPFELAVSQPPSLECRVTQGGLLISLWHMALRAVLLVEAWDVALQARLPV